jgi:RNA polymerase sigma factor (sigma-70 family)
MDDSSLLKAFAQTGDECAFRALVDRHVDLVYAAARRQVRDDHLAEDVSQAVFIVLARKAASLRSDVVLPAWLVTTTRNVARDALRAQRRRQHHEQQAQQTMKSSTAPETFDEISPLLDDALARLREADREAITLRYLKGMPTSSVAAALGISSAAAEKRILRAIAKMRDSFSRRGVVLSTAIVSTALINAARPAPAGAATRIADGALAAVRATGAHGAAHRRMLRTRWLGVTSAAVAVLLFSAFIIASITQNFGDKRSRVDLNPRPRVDLNPIASPSTAAHPIKVGLLLSEFTATGWHARIDDAYGLKKHQTILTRLRRLPQIQLYTIVEPGPNPELEKQLPGLMKYGWLIDGSQAKALEKLDVIVADHDWHMRPDVLSAMDEAIQNGVGFLHQSGFAILTPSFNDQVCSMIAIKNAQWFEHPKPAVARVVAQHPVLKGLNVGDEIHGHAFYGGMGTIDGTPLIAAFEMDSGGDHQVSELFQHIQNELHSPATQPASARSFSEGAVFCPLYISQHGKGRVIACQWHNEPPVELDRNDDGSFYLRCIEWLAGRPVE